MPAPINHTCPLIDKYIKYIKWEIVSNSNLKNMDEKDLLDTASSMSSKLEDCIEYLEELRTSNDILRNWGKELESEVESLQNYINELECKQ